MVQRPRLVERVRPSVGRSGPEFVAGHRAAVRLVAARRGRPTATAPAAPAGRPGAARRPRRAAVGPRRGVELLLRRARSRASPFGCRPPSSLALAGGERQGRRTRKPRRPLRFRDDRSRMAWYFMALSYGGSRIRCVHGADDGPGRCGPLAVKVQDRSPYPASRAPQEASPDELGRTGGEMAANVSTDHGAETTPPAVGPSTLRRVTVVVGFILLPLGAIILASAPLLHASGWTGAALVAGRSGGADGRYRPGGRGCARRAPQVAPGVDRLDGAAVTAGEVDPGSNGRARGTVRGDWRGRSTEGLSCRSGIGWTQGGGWRSGCATCGARTWWCSGLPRGGVPVAAEVARALDAPLDVIVVRKLGVPFQPELAMGAVGEGGALVRERACGAPSARQRGRVRRGGAAGARGGRAAGVAVPG